MTEPFTVKASGSNVPQEVANLGEELRKIKVLVLANWRRDVKWDLSTALRASTKQFTSLHPFRTSGTSKMSALIDNLSVLLSEFYLPVIAIFKRHQYDVIVSWTSRTGVVYGILNGAMRSSRAAKHISVDFHIDLRRKDMAYRLRLALLRAALPGMDVCFCTSTLEEGIYTKFFEIAPGRFRFLPMSYPPYFEYPLAEKQNFIFSYGRSGRDFATLVEAARGIEVPVTILSKTFEPRADLPENVTILRRHTSEQELIELIRSARVVVVPLLHFDFSVGQIALTEVMSLGCPLIMTRNMATLEYATHLESAIFYEPQDIEDLRKQMRLLLDDPGVADRLGKEARSQAWRYSTRHVQVFLRTLSELAEKR
jgi:glycosyltransferase involved in cell wall biosynthesis